MRWVVALVISSSLLAGLATTAWAERGRGDGSRAVRPAPAASSASPAIADKAVVVDIYGVTMEVQRPVFHLEESGLLSVGKAKPLGKLVLWRGAHQLLLSPSRIAKLETREGAKPEGDLIEVRVTLVDGDVVEGKVALDLELRGTTRYGGYVVRVERCRRITFQR